VDKFARLAWDERSNAFFGSGHRRPPELIIQDELHLIAGALGSVAGLYEAALDTVVQLCGVFPKYIASTATIRMAVQQVKRLYGREVVVFPPPGLSCDDSFFARTVPLELDAWWTQVAYHGSLKGVGNSHTAFASAVRDFMSLLLPESKERSTPHIAQLTSLQTADENAEIFTRLKRTRDEAGCLDAVLATNMISVGLDVARLALMTINGQPLTTAEYIQASSRVGRSDVPGIVFANYYRDQARRLGCRTDAGAIEGSKITRFALSPSFPRTRESDLCFEQSEMILTPLEPARTCSLSCSGMDKPINQRETA
jgi:ATP-dependent helicase YprA (DUF1998 family)